MFLAVSRPEPILEKNARSLAYQSRIQLWVPQQHNFATEKASPPKKRFSFHPLTGGRLHNFGSAATHPGIIGRGQSCLQPEFDITQLLGMEDASAQA
ncbi:hypothetical protein GCM10011385_41340 [Nitratireductor aestuarii]|uniref:Uncharacterized protein n=1 Tax=Nitratireductor aestuarii TaxID=1735103 RepID=A0A916S4C6_9HYPH|nr:hypothetical protein GCM10011385_41340 [Nitratireductor aestuarii]